jgi:hypothetical protein
MLIFLVLIQTLNFQSQTLKILWQQHLLCTLPTVVIRDWLCPNGR